ncbi:hypothetical protein SO802_008548 [Lithocarpus litseifolius]|uniref:Neprosin PEP catalytic domain-containing protein n=1 Tax=Lithocarpus litseifolius TaxID=425828 RepID=A0AAW2D9P1_9ROSI
MTPPCGSGRTWSRAVKMTFCLFFLAPMSSVGIRNTNIVSSKKQKLEVRQPLKRLNKPALKTIKMRPRSHPEGFSFDESNNVSSNSKSEITQPWHLNGRCPEGAIPIRRTNEKDLLRANYGRKKHNTVPNVDDSPALHEYATLREVGDRYYGMNAEINVWNPRVQEHDEFSLAQFWVEGVDNNGVLLDSIEAGAMVYYDLYNDFETRLFTYWTSDAYQNTGCYNLLCPGFVQIDTRLALGANFEPYSEYGGVQKSINYFVYKDNVDGHWWLHLNNMYLVGYWPSSLFSVLSNSASSVAWGGEVVNVQFGGQHTTTQMGSGHFAEEGPSRASFFQNLKVMDAEQFLRGPRDNFRVVTHPNCYNFLKGDDFFYYGGPGRSLDCP